MPGIGCVRGFMLPDRYKGSKVFGLPAESVTFTNSERLDTACDRKWWFKHPEALVPKRLAEPLRFGDAFHGCMEDVYRWWMEKDTTFPSSGLICCPWCNGASCSYCGNGAGAALRYSQRWHREASQLGDGIDEARENAERLQRCTEGYMIRHGSDPWSEYRIIGVELSLARAVVNPRSGRPYRPVTSLIWNENTGQYRYPSSGEASGARAIPDGLIVKKVRWPWYQVGRLDALAVHRRSGVLYCIEHKTSKAPRRMAEGLLVDPQTSGYCWLVEGCREELWRDNVIEDPNARIAGYIFDVASSVHHRDPEPLKPKKGAPPELSVAKNRTIPSWRYLATLARMGLPLDSRYAEHVAYLRDRVDPKLFLREWGTVGSERLEEYGSEIYGVARQIHEMREGAARVTDLVDVDVSFPRNPICRAAGGHCPYRSPCIVDNESSRANFEVKIGAINDETDDPAEDAEDMGF